MNPRTHKPLRMKHQVRPMQREIIAFAGLYRGCSGCENAEISATIVTQASYGLVQWLRTNALRPDFEGLGILA